MRVCAREHFVVVAQKKKTFRFSLGSELRPAMMRASAKWDEPPLLVPFKFTWDNYFVVRAACALSVIGS